MIRITPVPAYKLYLTIGGIFSSFVVMAILLSFIYMPYDTQATVYASKFAPPSAEHLFGCDHFGRDVFSRTLEGARLTVLVSVFGVLIALTLGGLFGSIAGYFGGWVDNVVMLLSDSVMAFPGVLLALVFVAVYGSGVYNIIWALGIVFFPSYARVFRTGIRQLKDREFILQASIIGVRPIRLVLIHIFPNLMPQLIPAVVIGLANMALSEASMSYLGLGIQPPYASWGKMLKDAQSYILEAPWTIIFPSLSLLFYILGLYFLSEGISIRFGLGRHAK